MVGVGSILQNFILNSYIHFFFYLCITTRIYRTSLLIGMRLGISTFCVCVGGGGGGGGGWFLHN